MLGKVVELSLVLMLSRFDDVDFVFASELKIMNGDSSVNASIPKTKYVFNLRDHQSGGLGVWFRQRRMMSVWENPTSADLAWARSERIWLKHDGDRVKKAFCGGYFRTSHR